jgi:hypothetical protein
MKEPKHSRIHVSGRKKKQSSEYNSNCPCAKRMDSRNWPTVWDAKFRQLIK